MKACTIALLLLVGSVAAENCQDGTCKIVQDEASLVQKEAFVKINAHEQAELPTLPPPEEVLDMYDTMSDKNADKDSLELKEGATDVYSYGPDNGMSCLEGTKTYLEAVKYRITMNDSPMSKMYAEAEVEKKSCEERGFDDGPHEEKCFPKSQNFYHKEANTTESEKWQNDLKYGEGNALRAYVKSMGVELKEAARLAGTKCLFEGAAKGLEQNMQNSFSAKANLADPDAKQLDVKEDTVVDQRDYVMGTNEQIDNQYADYDREHDEKNSGANDYLEG